ncbi:MAG: hypothetical protein ACJAVI_005733 [Candidatus Azotimanducaceae bacterium]|jgi:hypothetical protein
MFDDEKPNLIAAFTLNLQTVQSSLGCAGVYCNTGCGIRENGLDKIVYLPKS